MTEFTDTYGWKQGLTGPAFGKRELPPPLPAYIVWAPDLGKPRAVVRAPDSLQARQEYAEHHRIAVTDCYAHVVEVLP